MNENKGIPDCHHSRLTWVPFVGLVVALLFIAGIFIALKKLIA